MSVPALLVGGSGVFCVVCAAVCVSCVCEGCVCSCACVFVGVGVGACVCSGGGVHADGAGLCVSVVVCVGSNGKSNRSGLSAPIISFALSMTASWYVGSGVV